MLRGNGCPSTPRNPRHQLPELEDGTKLMRGSGDDAVLVVFSISQHLGQHRPQLAGMDQHPHHMPGPTGLQESPDRSDENLRLIPELVLKPSQVEYLVLDSIPEASSFSFTEPLNDYEVLKDREYGIGVGKKDGLLLRLLSPSWNAGSGLGLSPTVVDAALPRQMPGQSHECGRCSTLRARIII